MYKTARYLVLGAILICTTGCITIGKDFNSSDLGWLRSNTTDKGEIYRSLGDPFRTGVDQGKITWTYGYYRYRVFGETCTKDLIIYYNPNGTVSSYTFNTSFPEEKKSWRDRRTP